MKSRIALLLVAAALVTSAAASAQGKIDLPVSQAELEKRVKTDSNDAAAHYNVALAYWNARRWNDVERELNAAIALDPRLAVAHLALSYVPYARDPKMWQELQEAGNTPSKELRAAIDQTDREYRRAFVIDPMVDLRVIAAAIPHASSYMELKEYLGEANADFFQGETDCMQGNYKDCEATLNRLLSEVKGGGTPRDDIYWFLGLAAAHNGRYDEAIKQFQFLVDRQDAAAKKVETKGLVHVPLRTNEYRYFIADFQQASGNSEAAIQIYHTVLENDIGLFMAHVRIANIYEAQKDYPHAIEERRNAVNANPDDASLQRDLGVTLGKSGNFAGAREALQAATAGLPRDTESWFWLGLACQQLGLKPEAHAAYEKVIALAPSRMAARVTQARQHLAEVQ